MGASSESGIVLFKSGRDDALRPAEDGRQKCDCCKNHKADNLDDLGGSTTSCFRENPENSMRNPVEDLQDRSPIKQVITSADGTAATSPKNRVGLDRSDQSSAQIQERFGENEEQAAIRLEKMQDAVRTLLECIGEDPNREGLLDTPLRYAKALLFLTEGYQVKMNEVVNNALFHEGHNEMVIVKDIDIYSLCEHHLMPFTGKESPPSHVFVHVCHMLDTSRMPTNFSFQMHIGYIPSDAVIGLSKLPRIAEIFSRRLQIQERLTKEAAQAIVEILDPQGVAVVVESSHLCMVMRGVEKASTTTLTSCMLGCFHQNSKTCDEFLSLIGIKR